MEVCDWIIRVVPSVPAIEALRDGGRLLRGAAMGFHLDRSPRFRLRTVGLTYGLGSAPARALSAYLRADDPATMDHPSREDFFLERRRVIVRALGPETKRQGRGGTIYEQETSQEASQGHDAKRGANR